MSAGAATTTAVVAAATAPPPERGFSLPPAPPFPTAPRAPWLRRIYAAAVGLAVTRPTAATAAASDRPSRYRLTAASPAECTFPADENRQRLTWGNANRCVHQAAPLCRQSGCRTCSQRSGRWRRPLFALHFWARRMTALCPCSETFDGGRGNGRSRLRHRRADQRLPPRTDAQVAEVECLTREDDRARFATSAAAQASPIFSDDMGERRRARAASRYAQVAAAQERGRNCCLRACGSADLNVRDVGPIRLETASTKRCKHAFRRFAPEKSSTISGDVPSASGIAVPPRSRSPREARHPGDAKNKHVIESTDFRAACSER